jgi:hypothetical protein
MKSFAKPTLEAIDAAIPLLSSPQHDSYFFARLQNPHWIAPLQEKNIFSHPPSAQRFSNGGVGYPIWPASRYLSRMAGSAPSEVATIFARLETDNASIVGDAITASLAMPVAYAALVSPLVARAARTNGLWLHLNEANELCVKLGNEGELAASLDLADALFSPRSEFGAASNRQRELYWYKQGLDVLVPLFTDKAVASFLPMMCDWLHAAIELTERYDADTGDDISCVWRPAIEEHEQNSDHQISSVLVGYARQAFEIAIRTNQMLLTDALQLVERYNFLVFRRLRVHLIGEFADQDTELFKRVALDRRYFEDHHFKHEYAILIGKRFEMLSDEEKNVWFEWIDRGPEMTNFDENFHSWHEREPTNQDRKDRIEYWQFEKLHLIRHDLEGDRLNFYRQMLATHGEPRMADLNVRSGPMRWGNESPFSVEQLSATSFSKSVEMVVAWKGERDSFEGPDLEGLASAFEQYVATNPVAFSTEAHLLIGKPAIFVRRFIRKVSDAISASQPVPIEPVLKLCRWVIEQPVQERNTPDDNRAGMVDRDWQWTRDEISRLIESVCTADRGDVPHYPLEAYRKEIWGLLESLCHDAARSYFVRDPSKDDLRTRDYLDVAINSPRGKAVEAALEYARWVANHIKVKEEKREIVPEGFASMPEVREMLGWQIAPENRTVEVLAIIGSKIPLLNWIDRNWLQTNANRIFDLPEIERNPHNAAGWAAWNAFLDWVPPHVDFYKIFKPQYAYAVGQCAKVPSAENSRHHPMNHLGEHLVLLHGRGQLELDDDEGILRTFLSMANADSRRHAIGFIGQVLERDNEVPQAILDRFMRLWDFYWSSVGKQDAEQRPDAWLFGPWFTSEVFPSEWAFSRLEEFAQVAGVPEPDHAVAEQLAKLAPSEPTRAVKILDHMVRKDQEGWKFYGWRKPAREILKLAIEAGGTAREIAIGLVDRLGRRGFVELGELLPR